MNRKHLRIPVDDVHLDAELDLIPDAQGTIVFAHGSGSGRRSPRNRFVAHRLQDRFATLLIDLLSEDESELDGRTGELRFDIGLLGRRLTRVVEFLAAYAGTRTLPVGLYGSSTGAAAALVAASKLPDAVTAIVSRGGRPDLASEILGEVYAPTLFIVGGEDLEVLRLNDLARERLRAPNELAIVPRASHLFEEPGALAEVGELAFSWFSRYLHAAVGERPRL
jgi:pimeloyl-ACP methyl ester carboxylesterase